MKAVVGFLLMSLQVAHAVKPSCDGRQNGSQCFGVLGGAVDIQLMDNVSEIPRFRWTKVDTGIQYIVNNIVLTPKDEIIRFFLSNGSVRINDLRRNDSSEYKLEMFDGNGKNIGLRTLQLFVKDPVSSVQQSHKCLSEGQMKVSCASQGDSPQYSWTLDGHTLTDSELFSRNNETNIIILRQNISGRLVCSVRNEVSNSSEGMNLTGCGFIFINCTSNGTQIAKWVYKENNTLCVEPTVPPTTKYTSVGKKTQSHTSASSPNVNDQPWYIKLLPVMGSVLAALVIVLVASIVFICVHKKKKNTKVVNEDNDQEMTYADVRIVKKQGRRVEKSEEADVEYGQVKFSKKPRISQTNPTVDDTVYAQVRKGR